MSQLFLVAPMHYFPLNVSRQQTLQNLKKKLKPGGPHSADGFASDFRKDLQWFRFTGSANTEILFYFEIIECLCKNYSSSSAVI